MTYRRKRQAQSDSNSTSPMQANYANCIDQTGKLGMYPNWNGNLFVAAANATKSRACRTPAHRHRPTVSASCTRGRQRCRTPGSRQSSPRPAEESPARAPRVREPRRIAYGGGRDCGARCPRPTRACSPSRISRARAHSGSRCHVGARAVEVPPVPRANALRHDARDE